MRKPGSMRGLEELGRIRLSPNFFMRDFLYSEIANFYGIPNLPENPDLAVTAGRRLCADLLEPIQGAFGRIAIRSGYRSAKVTEYGNKRRHGASVERNAGYHLWDARDRNGRMGAAACIVIPWFADRYANGADWRSLAWWIHDHLPYAHLQFYPKLCAFNILWREQGCDGIESFIIPKGYLTRPGMPNFLGDHADWYEGFPALKQRTVGFRSASFTEDSERGDVG
jgi:hypothetical protein